MPSDGHGRVRRPVKSDIRRATQRSCATPSSVIASFSTEGQLTHKRGRGSAQWVRQFEQLAAQADFDLCNGGNPLPGQHLFPRGTQIMCFQPRKQGLWRVLSSLCRCNNPFPAIENFNWTTLRNAHNLLFSHKLFVVLTRGHLDL